jgi:hypothetical protein
MEKIKAWWYKLVASDLVLKIKLVDARLASEKIISDALRKELNSVRRRYAEVTEKLHMKLANDDSRAAVQILRERMGMDSTLPGKLDIVRQQLRQELAVACYHDELLEHYASDQCSFDDLPLEERKRYFKMIDDQTS